MAKRMTIEGGLLQPLAGEGKHRCGLEECELLVQRVLPDGRTSGAASRLS